MIRSAKAFVRVRKSSFSSFIPHPSTFPRSRSTRTRFGAVLFLQERQHLLHQRVRGDAVFFAKDGNGSVLDELVGPADPDDGRVDHLGMEMLHDRATKTVVQDVVLD